MPSLPTISVIMPVYNAGPYIKKAIQSILNQTFKDFEFIIINDGSTDNSLSIIKKFAKNNSKIKIINRKKTGIVGALNAGISIAHGKYIARMDADDIAFPHRLQTQFKYMEKHPECSILGSWVLYIDKNECPIFTYKPPQKHKNIERELMQGNGGCMIHPSIFIQKSLIKKVGTYDEKYQFIEDIDLYLKLKNEGKFHNINQPLLKFRQHFKSVHKNRNEKLIQLKVDRYLKEGVTLSLASNYINNNHFRVKEYKKWIYHALEEKYYRTAIKYALATIIKDPLKKHSWSCLSYCVKTILAII